MTIPARMVGTKTGDWVVVAAASEERVVAAGAADCAAAVIAVVGTTVGVAVAAVPFCAAAAVPATAVVAGGTVVREAVVTEGVTEDVSMVVGDTVAVTVGTGELDADPTIADTGIATVRTRSMRQNRIRFKENCGIIREHWMPGDMRIMERGAGPWPGQQAVLPCRRLIRSLASAGTR